MYENSRFQRNGRLVGRLSGLRSRGRAHAVRAPEAFSAAVKGPVHSNDVQQLVFQ